MTFWKESQEKTALLKGKFLTEAERWAQSHPRELSGLEKDYIRLSVGENRRAQFWKIAQLSILAAALVVGLYFALIKNRVDTPGGGNSGNANEFNGNGGTGNANTVESPEPVGTPTPQAAAPDPIPPTPEIPLPAKYYRLVEGRKPEYIIIHSLESQAGVQNVAAYYHNPPEGLRVSVHYVVGKDGAIAKLLDESKHTAFHVRTSQDKRVSNANSIGIELVGFAREGFPDVEVSALKDLLKKLASRHRINPNNILGHNEVPGSDRTDPGKLLNMNQIREEVRAASQ